MPKDLFKIVVVQNGHAVFKVVKNSAHEAFREVLEFGRKKYGLRR